MRGAREGGGGAATAKSPRQKPDSTSSSPKTQPEMGRAAAAAAATAVRNTVVHEKAHVCGHPCCWCVMCCLQVPLLLDPSKRAELDKLKGTLNEVRGMGGDCKGARESGNSVRLALTLHFDLLAPNVLPCPCYSQPWVFGPITECVMHSTVQVRQLSNNMHGVGQAVGGGLLAGEQV